MTYRIMIVDDDADMRLFTRMALTPKYEVVEAHDGLDALHKLETYQPDFAVLDLEMPVMDGLQLCQAIRRHPLFQTMPVLFLTGHDEKEMIKKGYAAGANLYMIKPVDPERLLKNVDFTFEHEPRPPIRKRHTIQQLKAMEEAARQNPGPVAAPDEPIKAAPPRKAQLAPRAAPVPPPQPDSESSGPSETFQSVTMPTAGARARVMIVDDEDDILQLMELSLNREFEVTMARNGMEAIERLVDYQPDIMLLDVMMPRMNGLQLLQIIRRNANYRRMPILIVSAKATDRDRQHALRMGANDFLAKPFTPEELSGRVRALTQVPGFSISPKSIPIDEIIKREYLAAKEKTDLASQDERRQKYREMEEVIKEQSRRML